MSNNKLTFSVLLFSGLILFVSGSLPSMCQDQPDSAFPVIVKELDNLKTPILALPVLNLLSSFLKCSTDIFILFPSSPKASLTIAILSILDLFQTRAFPFRKDRIGSKYFSADIQSKNGIHEISMFL